MQPDMPLYYLPQIEMFLHQHDIARDKWLTCSGVSEGQLSGHKIPFSQFSALVIQAHRLSGQDDIGLQLGRLVKINHHGALGFALMNCMSLNQALALLERFIRLRSPLLSVDLSSVGQCVEIRLQENYPFDDVRQVYLQAVTVTLYDALAFVFDAARHVKRVSFSFTKPAYAKQFAEYFECEVLFEQAHTGLLIDPQANHIAGIGDPSAFEQAQRLCEQELRLLEHALTLTEQIHDALMGQHQFNQSLNDIAARLNMTPRTLHRRLSDEGTSFHVIQDDVKATYARHVLSTTSRSIKQLAYELGYTDVANFRRAFKRWQRQSPQQFRQSNQLVRS